MLINYGKLEGVTSTEEEISIKYIKKTLLAFKCQVVELEFNLMISKWTLQEQE